MSDIGSIVIHSAVDSGTPIVTGCPFPLDVAPCPGSAEVVFPDGARLPAQVAELIPRTSAGMKWLELSFVSPQSGPARVDLVSTDMAGPKLAATTARGLLLDNSRLRVELTTDAAKPPVAISWPGGSGTFAPDVTADGHRSQEPKGGDRTVRIVRNGALRCRAEICGQLFTDEGKPSLRYRLAVEMWQDRPGLRVDWMLSHEIPGLPEVSVTHASLTGDWELGGSTERVFLQPCHTAEYQPRVVRNPDPVTVIVDDKAWGAHVLDEAMLLDDSVYPFYCKPGVAGVLPWLQLHGESGAVCATVKDFVPSRPNALESAEGRLSYLMVPEGQGLTWPQGRRKEQNLLLSFSSVECPADVNELARLADSLFAIGHAMPTPGALVAGKCFDVDRLLPFNSGENVRMNNLLDSYCHLNTPYEKWDLGDTPNWHYTLGYGAGLNQYFPLEGTCPPPKRFGPGGSNSAFLLESTAWFIEPVWTNNEYDMIHALASEVMRTGKPDHFDMLRWATRHNIEVDFVAYSDDPRHHRASPFHSHFHNRKGAITSHFWTQGLLEYYCLTGDDDVREVALALGEKIIEIDHSGVTAEWKFDREIGWALLALVCLLESGFEQYRDEAESIADFLQRYDRSRFQGQVNLSGGKKGRSLERQMIDCGFGYASMVEALDKYQRLTGRQEAEVWMNQLLLALKTELWNKVGDGEIPTVHNLVGVMMAIGYERTGDSDFLLAGELALEHYLDAAFPLKHPLGGEDGQSKCCAMSHRCVCRLSGALSEAGRLGRYEYPAVREHRSGVSGDGR